VSNASSQAVFFLSREQINMSSPFQVFRKNQQRLLVVFGVLLMVSFIIVPILTDFIGDPGGAGNNALVIKWDGGSIREIELRSLIRRNTVTDQFLNALLERAEEKDEEWDGRQYLLRRARSREDVLNNLLLAEKAKRLKLVITDDAVVQYLKELTDKSLSTKEFYSIQQRVAGEQQFSMPEIFDEIRTALAAQYVENLLYAGVGSVPPKYHWESFRRLNEVMELELIPISVAEFKSAVTNEPKPSELRKIYDDRKDFYPVPNSPEFGFRRLPKIDFHYVKFDFDKYLEQAKAALTDEEIATEYQKSIENGEFRKPVTVSPIKDVDESETDTEKSDTEKSDTEKSDTEKSDEEPTQDKTTPSGAEKSDAEALGPDRQSSVTVGRQPQYVSTQSQETTSNDNAGSSEPPKTQPDSTQPDGEDGGSDPDNDKPDKPSTETPTPAEAFRPLEEVRDQIVERLARPKAQSSQDDAMEAVRSVLSQYAQDYNIAKFSEGQEIPDEPSAITIATKNGASGGQTGPLDYIAIGETELGQSQRFEGFQYQNFDRFAFNPNLQFYASMESVSKTSTDIRFIFWKAEIPEEEAKAFVPSYEDCEEEVKDAWTTQQARELAEEKTEVWIKAAKAAKGLDLGELLPDQADQVQRTDEFSWLTKGTLSMFGAGGPELGTIDGIDGVTAESMEQVFQLKEDEIVVLNNATKSEYYVARVDYRGPSENTMRIRFSMDRISSFPPTAQADLRLYTRDLLERIDQELNVERFYR
jgi:hypothetical protein